MWKEMFHASVRTGVFAQLLFVVASQFTLLFLVVDFDWQIDYAKVNVSIGLAAFCFWFFLFFCVVSTEKKDRVPKSQEIALASLVGISSFMGACWPVLLVIQEQAWFPLMLFWLFSMVFIPWQKGVLMLKNLLLLMVLPAALVTEMYLFQQEVYVLSVLLVWVGGFGACVGSHYFERIRARPETTSEPESLMQSQ